MQIQAEYGKVFIFYIPLVTAGAADLKANPTLTSGDVKLSKDGGSFTNLTTLPVVTPSGGVAIKVTLSATEVQMQQGFITFIDQTPTKEWEDQTILITTDIDSRRQRTFDLVSLLEKHIFNKLVVGDTEIILYDDDGTTVLKTWPWNPTTATRGAAT